MAGFIVLEDGRSYAASGRATDAVIRAIAAELADPVFAEWLTGCQAQFLGSGMGGVDVRQIAPQHREPFYEAARAAFGRARDNGFEHMEPGSDELATWLSNFGDLIEMVDRWRAGEAPELFNPHVAGLEPPTDRREGPGWT